LPHNNMHASPVYHESPLRTKSMRHVASYLSAGPFIRRHGQLTKIWRQPYTFLTCGSTRSNPPWTSCFPLLVLHWRVSIIAGNLAGRTHLVGVLISVAGGPNLLATELQSRTSFPSRCPFLMSSFMSINCHSEGSSPRKVEKSRSSASETLGKFFDLAGVADVPGVSGCSVIFAKKRRSTSSTPILRRALLPSTQSFRFDANKNRSVGSPGCLALCSNLLYRVPIRGPHRYLSEN
jgi:hypothetical protein